MTPEQKAVIDAAREIDQLWNGGQGVMMVSGLAQLRKALAALDVTRNADDPTINLDWSISEDAKRRIDALDAVQATQKPVCGTCGYWGTGCPDCNGRTET